MARTQLSPSQMAGIVVALPIGGLCYYFITNPGLLSKLWVVVVHNEGMWVAMVLGIIYALWRRFKKPEQFMWGEVPVQITATAVLIVLFYSIFFMKGTDLGSEEFWNGYATYAEYQEPYRSESEDCDDDGHCTTSCDVPHGPEWIVYTSANPKAGERIGINSKEYRAYVKRFGNETITSMRHVDQCSVGDGKTFTTVFRGGVNDRLATAHLHPYVDYVKGANDTLMRRRGISTSSYSKFLRSYPANIRTQYGRIGIDRVIVSGVSVPSDWVKAVDYALDMALTELGNKKQCNVLVYIAGTEDKKFFAALEQEWVRGRKNDIIVVIGTTDFPSVAWVKVMTWTESSAFANGLSHTIEDMGSIDNPATFVQNVVATIDQSVEKGGYKRMPMAELTYLAHDVSLPMGYHILVILLAGFFSWVCSWALEHNEFRSFTARLNNLSFRRRML